MKKISIFLIVILAVFAANLAFAIEQPDMSVYAPDITQGETAHVQVTLPSDAEGNVTASVNGKQNSTMVVDGNAVIDLNNLSSGEYNISVTYEGSGNYSQITKVVNLKVNATSGNASGSPSANDNGTNNATNNVSNSSNTTNNLPSNTTNNSTNKASNSTNTIIKVDNKTISAKEPPKNELHKEPLKFNDLTQNKTGIPIAILVLVLMGIVFGIDLRRK